MTAADWWTVKSHWRTRFDRFFFLWNAGVMPVLHTFDEELATAYDVNVDTVVVMQPAVFQSKYEKPSYEYARVSPRSSWLIRRLFGQRTRRPYCKTLSVVRRGFYLGCVDLVGRLALAVIGHLKRSHCRTPLVVRRGFYFDCVDLVGRLALVVIGHLKRPYCRTLLVVRRGFYFCCVDLVGRLSLAVIGQSSLEASVLLNALGSEKRLLFLLR